MTPERLDEIEAALGAVPAPPWRWIGTRGSGGPQLVTDHSGQQHILRAAKPVDRHGDEYTDAYGAPAYGDLEFRDKRGVEKYFVMRDGAQLAVGRTEYDPDSIIDVDNPVARWIRRSAEYAAELVSEVGWQAAAYADLLGQMETSARIAEDAWKRNRDLLAEAARLREELARPMAVWRAYYQGAGGSYVPVGLYRTEDAARAHCEDLLRCEDAAGSETAVLDWIGDEDDPEEPRELCVTLPGLDEAATGYCVVQVPVADAYDPDAEG